MIVTDSIQKSNTVLLGLTDGGRQVTTLNFRSIFIREAQDSAQSIRALSGKLVSQLLLAGVEKQDLEWMVNIPWITLVRNCFKFSTGRGLTTTDVLWIVDDLEHLAENKVCERRRTPDCVTVGSKPPMLGVPSNPQPNKGITRISPIDVTGCYRHFTMTCSPLHAQYQPP